MIGGVVGSASADFTGFCSIKLVNLIEWCVLGFVGTYALNKINELNREATLMRGRREGFRTSHGRKLSPICEKMCSEMDSLQAHVDQHCKDYEKHHSNKWRDRFTQPPSETAMSKCFDDVHLAWTDYVTKSTLKEADLFSQSFDQNNTVNALHPTDAHLADATNLAFRHMMEIKANIALFKTLDSTGIDRARSTPPDPGDYRKQLTKSVRLLREALIELRDKIDSAFSIPSA